MRATASESGRLEGVHEGGHVARRHRERRGELGLGRGAFVMQYPEKMSAPKGETAALELALLVGLKHAGHGEKSIQKLYR